MKSPFIVGVALAFATMCILTITAAYAEKFVKIGSTEVVLPQMDGFADVYGQNPDLDAMARHMVPASMKLLAFYVSNDDFAAVMRPKRGLKKYIMVETGVDEPISDPRRFEAIKKELAEIIRSSPSWKDDKDIAAAVKSASDYFSDKYNRKVEFKPGEAHSLGTILDKPDALSMIVVQDLEVTNSKGHHSKFKVVGTSVLNLKSAPVYAILYCPYHSGADIDFASQSTKEFVTKALALNNENAPIDANGSSRGK